MNNKISYGDYVYFIEHILNIKLFEYQKTILKYFYKTRSNKSCKTKNELTFHRGKRCNVLILDDYMGG